MTRVQIINIDLGANIDDIINEGISEITDKNQQDIDEAISEATAKRTLKEQKIKKPNKEPFLEQAYELLLESFEREEHVPAKELVAVTAGAFSSLSGLTLSLKTYLRKKQDNKYILQKSSKNGQTTYYLHPFNTET